jgi:superfamily I DNA and RNA helicase
MDESLFYNNVIENEKNKTIVDEIKSYVAENGIQVYLITAPLAENKYSYPYEENAIIILSPNYKIIFIDLNSNEKDFKDYYLDFLEDFISISDKYNYKDYIGRLRKWEKDFFIRKDLSEISSIADLLEESKLVAENKRKNELIISLLIGSINDISQISLDEPDGILEKIRNKILLFDAEQTRFIYKNTENKCVFIQGLSGTGKTELLLHKLKEIYAQTEDSKIFFTCHNIALANTLQKRVKDFFNFMKIDKQIEWNKRLWVDRAWGSQGDKNSGLYSYICNFYNISFSGYSVINTYEKIFKKALEEINKIDAEDFEYAFDYILIDERQDFPDILFELCEKITKEKVYVAGDIFQEIFEDNIEDRVVNVDFILNKCYRTDPRTLMFSHAIGMGLFESKKLNWLTDKEWEACGYDITRNENQMTLSRGAIPRFEELNIDTYDSMKIEKHTGVQQVIDIIKNIKSENPTLKPDDIAVIVLDESKAIYNYFDTLEFEIRSQLEWEVTKSYESKSKVDDTIFISNKNNIKGLEFPFVICVTAKIKDDLKYRNTLYTMLTRSFIQSYLLVQNDTNLEVQIHGLDIINKEKCIKTIIPTDEEREDIRKTILKLKEELNISFEDFLTEIFNDLKIGSKERKKLKKMMSEVLENNFDKDVIVEFIESNKRYL